MERPKLNCHRLSATATPCRVTVPLHVAESPCRPRYSNSKREFQASSSPTPFAPPCSHAHRLPPSTPRPRKCRVNPPPPPLSRCVSCCGCARSSCRRQARRPRPASPSSAATPTVRLPSRSRTSTPGIQFPAEPYYTGGRWLFH
jgi:hypothetical protein